MDAVAADSAVGYDGVLSWSRGPVAQLGARLNGIQEVTGSNPVRSTIPLFGSYPRTSSTTIPTPAAGVDGH
jgi:hypothetical protein